MSNPIVSARLSRRAFVKTALAAASVPLILPSRLLGDMANSRVRVGHIGCGRIAQVHDMPGVQASDLADVVAVCDLDSRRVMDGKHAIEAMLAKKGRSGPRIDTYGNYRELLARKDIDAVVISTPDHWHAELALAAIGSGKDVYLQKPMTMTVAEGIRLRDEIGKTDRIFQLGSQQRSSAQFRQACECVRSGRVGTLQRIEIGLPIDPTAPDNPEQPIPSTFNYEAWKGPTPDVYYTEQRVHPQKPGDISRPGWLRTESHCLGMITGWGAHHYDIAHWAMDVELSGPSRVEGTAVFPTNKIWNVHGAYHVELTYPKNVKVVVSDKFPNGLKFIGDGGWIWVTRDGQVTASDPTAKSAAPKPLDASDPRLLDPNGLAVHLPVSTEHHLNWLQCVQSRKTPMTPAPIAHRSNTACVVSWIAMKLNRPLTWDPKTERFVNDPQADAMLSLPERPGYGINNLKLA